MKKCVFVFFFLIVLFAVSCRNKEFAPQEEDPAVTEEQIITAEIDADNEEESSEHEQGGQAAVSASSSVQRPLSSLSGIAGRVRGLGVDVSEIDPINYENPDIDIMRQMGVEQYLLSFFEGEKYYKEANFDKAITEYTASINGNNRFIEALISRANAYMKKREYGRAIDDYSRAISINSGRAELYNYRGFART